jgi:hypothetical protein
VAARSPLQLLSLLLQLSYCNCLIAIVIIAMIVSVALLLLFWVFGCICWPVLLSSWIFVSLLPLPLLLLLLSLLLYFCCHLCHHCFFIFFVIPVTLAHSLFTVSLSVLLSSWIFVSLLPLPLLLLLLSLLLYFCCHPCHHCFFIVIVSPVTLAHSLFIVYTKNPNRINTIYMGR